ncbi:MAG TPA: CapA family protein [Ignavibacteria bacterium]|nr:CapA family protein [Ignavibacteria bacterium]
MPYLKLISVIFLTFAILGIAGFFLGNVNNSQPQETFTQDTAKLEEPPKPKIFSVIGVGDIMMGTNYPDASSLPPNDGKNMLDSVAEILSSADVTFGNLEGTLLNSGGTPKDCGDSEHCHSFRMPEHYAGHLKNAGFDMLSVANNHSGDMGPKGRKSTVNTLDEYGIKYAGYTTHPYTVFEKDGVRFGLAAFAPNNGTVPLNDHDNAVKIIKELKSKCDILIVSFHGGAEGSGASHVPKRREIFLGEDRGNVYEFSRLVVDAGADIVFGHGPHVPRGMEIYKDRLIAYSLGNFCTYKKFGLSGILGIAPILKVYVNDKGEYQKSEIISIKQVKGGIPVIDSSNAAEKLVRKLSREDFGAGDF